MTALTIALIDRVPQPIHDALGHELKGAGFEFVALGELGGDARRDALKRADYAISYRGPLGPPDFPKIGRLRLIQRWGAGYDGVDVAGLGAMGLAVLRTAGANATFVAEQALTLTLATLRETVLADRNLRSGRWESERHYTYSSSLMGKTVGLIGYGTIARHFERLLEPFGGQILVHARRSITPHGARTRQVTLPELLATSDVVSLHVPLTPETSGLIGSAELARMRPTAILVNTSRGGVVDEAALAEALSERGIAGAGIDVFAQEPTARDNPLLALDNVVLTPHLGGKVRENVDGIIARIVANLTAHARGEAVTEGDVLIDPAA